jgi:hypothetical protein
MFRTFHSALLQKTGEDIKVSLLVNVGGTKHQTSLHCLMLGLPFEITNDEFLSFIEPFIEGINNIQILINSDNTSTSLPNKSALLSFDDIEIAQNFASLYNNLHFPSHRLAPPCLVLLLHSVENISKQQFKNADTDSSFSTNSCNPSQPSSNPKLRHLPMCCVCLRRLKSSASLIPGSNDIPVSMKFQGNGARCLVCRIYGGMNQSESISQSSELSHDQSISETNDLLIDPTKNNASLVTLSDGLHHSLSIDNNRGHFLSNEFSTVTTEGKVTTDLRFCLTCQLKENIWACLICGHTGCGRSVGEEYLCS